MKKVEKQFNNETTPIFFSILFVLVTIFALYYVGEEYAQATHRDQWSNSYDIHEGVSGVEIDRHGACRVYSNTTTSYGGSGTLIPLRLSLEYLRFRANYPSNITQGGCTSPPTSPPPSAPPPTSPPPSGCSYPSVVCQEICDQHGCSGCAGCYSWNCSGPCVN